MTTRAGLGPAPLLGAAGLFALVVGPLSGQRAAEYAPSVREFIAVDAPMVVIEGVRLVDGTGGAAREGMRVTLAGERILSVEPAAGPLPANEALEVVDGSGRTLLPGWVMLHEHMFYPAGQTRYNTHEVTFPYLYLASGTTTIRTGGSLDPYTDLRIRQRIEAGEQPGPRMDVTGPYLEGEGGFVLALPELRTPEEARAHVNFWVDRGATSFKAYNLIDRATLGAAIETAHDRGVKVTGHLCSVTYTEAAALGINNLEHGFSAATDWVDGKEPDVCPRGGTQSLLALDLRSRTFLDVVDRLVAEGVAITWTPAVSEGRAGNRPPVPAAALASLAPSIRARIERVSEARTRAVPEPQAEAYRRDAEMVRIFRERGGRVVVGTDPTGAGDAIPGYANLRTLELLVEAGFTFVEAVEIATLEGARYLERDGDIGSVEPGKLADLVLIGGDPEADVGDVWNVELVFKGGIGWDSAALFDRVRENASIGIR